MDSSITDAAWQGFQLVFSWPNILYPTVATLLAMVFSFLPGLTGITLMALVISLTFSWDPLRIVLVFGALTGGATFMGSVTAILFNIPGSAPNAATMLDGYPLTQQGKARTAIACAATSSALGSTIGILMLVLLLPFLQRFILAFGPAEFLALAIWGLAMIGMLTGPSLVKGLAAAGLGLLLATIGLDQSTAESRFTFGIPALQGGLDVVPVFLGIFAIAEMLNLTASGRRDIVTGSTIGGSVRDGIAETFRHPGLLLRSSILGAVIGMVPAIGATVAGFLARGHAIQSAEDRSRFGHGDIRGVLAPEAAHDAKDGGSLAPTLAFGIPGSEGTAILLAALTLHGLVPGRELLTMHLPLVFALIFSLFYSNWLTSVLGVLVAGPAARSTLIPVGLLAPLVLTTAALGAYIHQGRFSDVVIAFVFGVAGFYLKRNGWPRIPLVTALVLGPFFETNLGLAMTLQRTGGIDILRRPVVWILMALVVVTLGWPKLRERLHRP